MENEVLISKDDLLNRLYYETSHILRKNVQESSKVSFMLTLPNVGNSDDPVPYAAQQLQVYD